MTQQFEFITTDARPALPDSFKCPICGAAIIIDDIDEWERNDDGTWQAGETAIKIDCVTEPDIDSDEWRDWFRGHWSMPYVDWLPLCEQVALWFNARYRFIGLDEAMR